MKKKLTIIISFILLIAIAAIPFLADSEAIDIPSPQLPVRGDDTTVECSFKEGFAIPHDQQAALYEIDIADREELITQVENSLNLENLQDSFYFAGDEGEAYYLVEDRDMTICINATNGFWDATSNDTDENALEPPTNLPSDKEAEEIARLYIEENGLFDGELGNAVITHSYSGSEETGDRVDLDVRVTWNPEIEGSEVYGLYRICVVLGDNGIIHDVFKQASPAHFKQNVTLKSEEEIIDEVINHPDRITIAGSGSPYGTIQSCDLKYYFDGIANNGILYVYPVFVLHGQAEGLQKSMIENTSESFSIIVDAIRR